MSSLNMENTGRKANRLSDNAFSLGSQKKLNERSKGDDYEEN